MVLPVKERPYNVANQVLIRPLQHQLPLQKLTVHQHYDIISRLNLEVMSCCHKIQWKVYGKMIDFLLTPRAM